jgi:hypothetical protein
MKKCSFLLIFILLFVSCGDVAEFQDEQQSLDAAAKNIANYLADFAEIEDCNVQIDGTTALISLNLARKHNDTELIALKKRIAADIKSQNSDITRVAVNTAPDMIEGVLGDADDTPQIENALEGNDDKEIFVNIAPNI